MNLEIDYPSYIDAFKISLPVINNSSPEQLFVSYFTYIFTIIIAIGALLLTVKFLWAGFQFLFSRGSPEKYKDAKETLSALFFGGLILFSSFLILKTINPFLVVINLPSIKTEKIDTSPIGEYTAPSSHSLIFAELPFGPTIQRIFADEKTNITDLSLIEEIFEETVEKNPAVTALKKNSDKTVSLIEEIKTSSNSIVALTSSCKCNNASGRCAAGCSPAQNSPLPTEELSDENKSIISDYNKGSSCSGDPCSKRGEINDLSDENKLKIENLLKEIVIQKKIEMIFKEELSKLKTEKTFMKTCPLNQLDSLSNFSSVKDYYDSMEWFIGSFEIWKGLNKNKNPNSFYCPVSGNTEKFAQIIPINLGDLGDLENSSSNQPTPVSSVSCEPIPVGEIIDRAERTTLKVIDKIQRIIELERNLINKVNQLQILVSRCVSQAPMCQTVCEAIPGGCIASCQGNPCPSEEINNRLKEIEDIAFNQDKQSGIKNIIDNDFDINDNKNYENPKEIGLKQIIETTIPDIIKKGLSETEGQLKECLVDYGKIAELAGSEDFQENVTALVNCQTAIYQTDQEGNLIESCCEEEKPYEKCLENCYLKKDYQKCLPECLKNEDNKKGASTIQKCRHKINFYCCR